MADGNSDIGFARLCFIAGVQASAAQKSYKLSSGMRTWPAECSKLGRDTDHRRYRHPTG